MSAADAPYLQIIGGAGKITINEKPKKTIVYPTVYEEYRTHWGIKEAIREFIANAIDATQGYPDKYEISILKDHDRKYLVIANAGAGMNYIDFYLGGSSAGKAGQHTIGRFHEGMKVASWILLKKDTNPETPPVMIFWKEKDTGSYHLTLWKSKEDSEIGGKLPYLVDYEVPKDIRALLEQTGKSVVVVIDLGDVDTDGEVTAEMLNDIYIRADHPGIRFVLNPEEAPIKQFWIIETGSGPSEHNSIYVGGIKIASVGKIAGKAAVFSYNFPPGDLKTLEESRRSMQYSELLKALGEKYLKVSDPAFWRKFFNIIERWHEDSSHGSLLEEEMNLWEVYDEIYDRRGFEKTFEAVSKALVEVYGKNVVVISPDHAKEKEVLSMIINYLEYNGFKVLSHTTDLFLSIAKLAEKGYVKGVRSTKQALEELKKISYRIIPENELSPFSRRVLRLSKKYGRTLKNVLDWLMERELLSKSVWKIFGEEKEWDVKDVYVVAFNDTYRKITESTSSTTLGFYDKETNIIGINLEYINELEQKVQNGEITKTEAYIQILETMTEEVIHAVTGYTDLEERKLFNAAKMAAAYFYLASDKRTGSVLEENTLNQLKKYRESAEKLEKELNKTKGELEEMREEKERYLSDLQRVAKNYEKNKKGYYLLLDWVEERKLMCEEYSKQPEGIFGKIKRKFAKVFGRLPDEHKCKEIEEAYNFLKSQRTVALRYT